MSWLHVGAAALVELVDILCAGGECVFDPLSSATADGVPAEEGPPMQMTLNAPASAPAPETGVATESNATELAVGAEDSAKPMQNCARSVCCV